METPLRPDPIPPANWKHADYLQCCVYLSDEGVPTKIGKSVGRGEESEKMFALAMKMCFDPHKNVKVGVVCTYLMREYQPR